jgi:hypothetical protein
MVFGLTMLVPFGVSWWHRDGAQAAYPGAMAVALVAWGC